MSIQISIIGLDRVGVSAAMALSAQHKDIRCKGWDPDREKCIAADAVKVFQPVCQDLKDTIKDAALVLITLPPQAFQSALADLKAAGLGSAILVNLSARHSVPAASIEAIFGADAPYISMLPALNPDCLAEEDDGSGEARADLFKGGRITISTSPRASEELLNQAAVLAVLLGGLPVFAEAGEVDGWAAANLLLPELAACVLMDAVSAQPSWRDGQMLAGASLAAASAPLTKLQAADWAQIALADSQNSLRVLDNLEAALGHLRQALLDEDQAALEEALRQSQSARLNWLEKRRRGISAGKALTSMPSEEDALKALLNLDQ